MTSAVIDREVLEGSARELAEPLSLFPQGNKPFNQSLAGKLGIRVLSRGLGAVAYALTGNWVTYAMKGYDPSNPLNTTQQVASLIDNTIGTGIQRIVKLVTRNDALADAAVTFRETKDFGHLRDGKAIMGRTLAGEYFGVALDFATMAILNGLVSDATTFFDPNQRHGFIKDGHIQPLKAAKAAAHSVWRAVTFSGGEDLFVTAPYLYYMKAQRYVLDKLCPGFRMDFDRNGNGGSLRVDDQGQAIGTYNKVGALDLALRFEAYNIVGTGYRNMYGAGERTIDRWKEDGFKVSPPQLDTTGGIAGMAERLVRTVGKAVKSGLEYVAVTATRVTLYMVPATAVFSSIRTSQSRASAGYAIHPERGVLRGAKQEAAGAAMEERKLGWLAENPEAKVAFGEAAEGSFGNPFARTSRKQLFAADLLPEGQVSPLGRIGNGMGGMIDNAATGIYNRFTKPLENLLDEKYKGDVETVTRSAVAAGTAYIPYLFIKTDAGATILEDADAGIKAALKGVLHLDWKMFSEGCAEVKDSIRRKMGWQQPERASRQETPAFVSPTPSVSQTTRDGREDGWSLREEEAMSARGVSFTSGLKPGEGKDRLLGTPPAAEISSTIAARREWEQAATHSK